MKILHTMVIGVISTSAIVLGLLCFNKAIDAYPKLAIICFATFLLFAWSYGFGSAIKEIWRMYKNP